MHIKQNFQVKFSPGMTNDLLREENYLQAYVALWDRFPTPPSSFQIKISVDSWSFVGRLSVICRQSVINAPNIDCDELRFCLPCFICLLRLLIPAVVAKSRSKGFPKFNFFSFLNFIYFSSILFIYVFLLID